MLVYCLCLRRKKMINKKDYQDGKSKKLDFQDITKFKLIYDNILVKEIPITNVKGVLRSKRKEDKPILGEVISVGTGRLLDTGEMKAMDIKVGDIILFNKYMLTSFNLNREEYFTLSEEDCIGYLR